MSKPLRQTMPSVAGWIDELREAFGAEMIDAAIRAGIAGQRTFYASENGVEVGTKDDRRGVAMSGVSIDQPARTAQAVEASK